MLSAKDILVRTDDPPGETPFQNGIKPALLRHPSLNALSLQYCINQVHGLIMVPTTTSEHPQLAIVERQPNVIFPNNFVALPSIQFMNELWRAGDITLENLPTGIAIGRRYPRLLDALLRLESSDEDRILADHKFQLDREQYFKLVASFERILQYR